MSVQMPKIPCGDGWNKTVLKLENEIVKWRFYTVRVGLSDQCAHILINRIGYEVHLWEQRFHGTSAGSP